jgi:hypothetical protein
MRNVQELIALGKVPADTRAAENQAGYPDGWPIFSDLSKQVRFDWDNLQTDRVRALKNDPTYKAALESFLLEGSVVVVPAEHPEVTLASSVEDEIQKAAEAPVVEPVATVEPEPVVEPVIVPAVVEDEGTKIEYPFGTIQKIKGTWEARVDNKDGSGVQVYKAKTKDELIGKLMQAQAHASTKIRQQEEDRLKMLAEEPADLAPARRVIQPRQLTADEQFEYAEAMTSGDPSRIHKAQEKRDAIRNGGTPEEIAGRLAEAENSLAVESYKNTAKAFMKMNDNVQFTRELGDRIDEILNENKWAYTVRNLNKVLAHLATQNEVTYKVSTQAEEEVELPAPTSAPVVAAAPAVVPAVVAPTRVPPATTPKAVERLRPGSASTGITPRQASVRQGQQPVAPVGLTAEEYNRMPVSETRQKYKTDPGFRSAVDKLIAEGKI